MAEPASLGYWRGRVDERLDDLEGDVTSHEKRISSVEQFMWKLIGVCAIGGLLGGCLATVAAYLILAALHHPA